MNDFSRNLTRTNIIPIGRGLTPVDFSRDNRLIRERIAAGVAARDLLDRQDAALRYLAIKQMKKDRALHRRFFLFIYNHLQRS